MLLLIVIFNEESFVPILLKRKAAHIRFTEKREFSRRSPC